MASSEHLYEYRDDGDDNYEDGDDDHHHHCDDLNIKIKDDKISNEIVNLKMISMLMVLMIVGSVLSSLNLRPNLPTRKNNL